MLAGTNKSTMIPLDKEYYNNIRLAKYTYNRSEDCKSVTINGKVTIELKQGKLVDE